MTRESTLKGVLSITPTPFNEDESLDVDGIQHLVEFYIEHDVSGLTILGVMGEAHKLLSDERAIVIDAFIAAADGRIPVLVGATHAGTRPAIAIAEQAERLGAAGLMIAPPSISSGDLNQQIREHYRSIGEAVTIPIVVQDYPPSTGVTLSPTLLAELADTVENIQYLKLEDPPTPVKLAKIRELAGDGFKVLGGLGGVFFFEELEQGAVGTMTGFAFPEILVNIYGAHARGEIEHAAELFYRYLPLIRFEFQPGIALAVRKEVMRRRGAIRTAVMRGPSTPLDAGSARELTNLVARLELA